MAVEWFYLENSVETGPVSSQQLKTLAGTGTIFPWTPVKRVAGSEVSPWTRAGAVQGMFAGNVREQLGDPICDDCGHRLESGKCLFCPAVPPAFEYEPRVDQANAKSAKPETDPIIQQITWKKPDTADFADGLLQAAGWFQIGIAVFVGFAFITRTTSPQFHTDNAMGASANALEQLLLLIGAWLNMFGGFAFFGFAALRRIRNAITPTAYQRYFR